jgi:hypothetical protein
MVCNCAVADCTNWGQNVGLGDVVISYHRFPKDDTLRSVWITRCCRKDRLNPKTATICSVHFAESCFERDLRHELLGLPIRRMLRSDAVPTEHLPYKKTTVVTSPCCARTRRAEKRKATMLLDDLLQADDKQHVTGVNVHDDHPASTSTKSCVTCDQLQKNVIDLQSECARLQVILKSV